MYDEQVLERANSWRPLEHTCYGRIQALYIRKKRKWFKIGEICTRCGEVGFLKEFKEQLRTEK